MYRKDKNFWSFSGFFFNIIFFSLPCCLLLVKLYLSSCCIAIRKTGFCGSLAQINKYFIHIFNTYFFFSVRTKRVYFYFYVCRVLCVSYIFFLYLYYYYCYFFFVDWLKSKTIIDRFNLMKYWFIKKYCKAFGTFHKNLQLLAHLIFWIKF